MSFFTFTFVVHCQHFNFSFNLSLSSVSVLGDYIVKVRKRSALVIGKALITGLWRETCN